MPDAQIVKAVCNQAYPSVGDCTNFYRLIEAPSLINCGGMKHNRPVYMMRGWSKISKTLLRIILLKSTGNSTKHGIPFCTRKHSTCAVSQKKSPDHAMDTLFYQYTRLCHQAVLCNTISLEFLSPQLYRSHMATAALICTKSGSFFMNS